MFVSVEKERITATAVMFFTCCCETRNRIQFLSLYCIHHSKSCWIKRKIVNTILFQIHSIRLRVDLSLCRRIYIYIYIYIFYVLRIYVYFYIFFMYLRIYMYLYTYIFVMYLRICMYFYIYFNIFKNLHVASVMEIDIACS